MNMSHFVLGIQSYLDFKPYINCIYNIYMNINKKKIQSGVFHEHKQ